MPERVVFLPDRGPDFLDCTALGALVLLVWSMTRQRENKQHRDAISQALEIVDANPPHKDIKKIPPAWAGAIYRGAGEFYTSKQVAAKAREYFTKAVGQSAFATDAAGAVDADMFRIWLTKSQVNLGGAAQQVIDGERVEWDTLSKEIMRPIEFLGPSECRLLAVRESCSALHLLELSICLMKTIFPFSLRTML